MAIEKTQKCYVLYFVVIILHFTCACLPRRNSQRPVVNVNAPISKRISVRDSWFIDKTGRVRIFHGWNSVQKSFPWYDDQILNETRLALFKSWGFNAVRLGTMWTGVEPSENQYNDTYIRIEKDIIEKLDKYGIYAILDMHQDVISTKFKAYDGVPRWLIDSLPNANHSYPWPLPKVNQWFLGYLTECVGHAFQSIYDNVSNSRDKFARFWQKIAKEFQTYDNILGYELINEPWAGDIYQTPGLLLPGEAGRRNLSPLYEVLSAAIRNVDQDTIIFYEPVTWGVYFGSGQYLGPGFRTVPGGEVYKNRSAFSYHYYCWFLTQDMHKPYPDLLRQACKTISTNLFSNIIEDVKKIGGGMMLTEFGLCTPDGSKHSANTIECEKVLRQADQALQSWTYWDSEFFYKNGSVIENTAKGFARTYARAVAGTPTKMFYNITTKEFYFKYLLNYEIQEYTEIFVPQIHYPGGFSVKVSEGMIWEFHDDVVYVKPRSDWSSIHTDNADSVKYVEVVLKPHNPD